MPSNRIRSSREKIYYQIKFLTGDIALSFALLRFRLSMLFWGCLQETTFFTFLFDSLPISDCSMCTNKIYFSSTVSILSFCSWYTMGCIGCTVRLYWFTGKKHKRKKVFFIQTRIVSFIGFNQYFQMPFFSNMVCFLFIFLKKKAFLSGKIFFD